MFSVSADTLEFEIIDTPSAPWDIVATELVDPKTNPVSEAVDAPRTATRPSVDVARLRPWDELAGDTPTPIRASSPGSSPRQTTESIT